ncbi:MAG TPA: hypothetical protein VMA98_11220 [Candidatus Acidoferrales bacterium]|nr:hypothetical protein [Candidatus Acidoferrales bacterium]
MLPGLLDGERRALARLATMLVAGALCVLPMTTQGSSIAGASAVAARARAQSFAGPSPLAFPAYTVDRDPFVPADPQVEDAPAEAPSGTASAPVLRAVIVGDPPRALVEVDGNVHVVGIGDRAGALTVVAIDADGIALSDGSRLTISQEHS